MDGVLGLAGIVVMDKRRVRRDFVAGCKPPDKVFLKSEISSSLNISFIKTSPLNKYCVLDKASFLEFHEKTHTTVDI